MRKGIEAMSVRSAVDNTYRFFHWGAVALISASLLMPIEDKVLGLVFLVPAVLFIFWLYLGTWYELRADHLYARSGPFRERIPYDRIRRIERCRNSFSSMALSRDRIGIWQHGKGFFTGTTYISPVDPDAFFKDLKDRCRNLDQEPDKQRKK